MRPAQQRVQPGILAAVLSLLAASACGGVDVRQFLAFEAPAVALVNVRIIDGSGDPAREGQTVVIQAERITAVGDAKVIAPPSGAKVLDLEGRTVLPGLVGMHDHLFYEVAGGAAYPSQESFAMLYLAAGVTTIRTAGALDFRGDLRIKRLIDEGRHPGPTVHITSPYLYAVGDQPDPARVANQVAAWADEGATSFKAYMTLRRDELAATINAAHHRGLRVTGHLCAVGFLEAASLGRRPIEPGNLLPVAAHVGCGPPARAPRRTPAVATLRTATRLEVDQMRGSVTSLCFKYLPFLSA